MTNIVLNLHNLSNTERSPLSFIEFTSLWVNNMTAFCVFFSIGTMSFDILKQIFHGTDEDDQGEWQENIGCSVTDRNDFDGLHNTDDLQ